MNSETAKYISFLVSTFWPFGHFCVLHNFHHAVYISLHIVQCPPVKLGAGSAYCILHIAPCSGTSGSDDRRWVARLQRGRERERVLGGILESVSNQSELIGPWSSGSGCAFQVDYVSSIFHQLLHLIHQLVHIMNSKKENHRWSDVQLINQIVESKKSIGVEN